MLAPLTRPRRRGLLLASTLAALGACGAPPTPPVTGAQRAETFRSAIAGEDYVLRLRLPPDYDADPSRRFPVLFQLDPTFVGLREMAITAGLVSEGEREGTGPAAIVVGVDYPDPFTRFRDYDLPRVVDPNYESGNADRFYRVMRDEIVPHIDATLRTRPGQRFLVGHSLGAVFALYAALRHDPVAGPPLFAGVVASDPGIPEALLTYERLHAARSATLPVRVYLARAAWNGPAQLLGHQFFADRLTGRSYQGLQFASEVFETDHGGVIEPSFARGLRFVLAGVP